MANAGLAGGKVAKSGMVEDRFASSRRTSLAKPGAHRAIRFVGLPQMMNYLNKELKSDLIQQAAP